MEHNITINGEDFTFFEDCGEWSWWHNVAGSTIGEIWKDSDRFPTLSTALKHAEAYMKNREAEEEEQRIAEEEDRRYGTYEEQVRRQYYSDCM